jgi:transposase
MLLPNAAKIFIAGASVDMRKSINGLMIAVIENLKGEPQSGSLFVFYNKRIDKIKILYWDRNGFCLWYKRLEKGKFKIPMFDDKCLEMTVRQLNWLLDGLDFTKLKGYKELKYSTFY